LYLSVASGKFVDSFVFRYALDKPMHQEGEYDYENHSLYPPGRLLP